jgi:hypothetical protein
MKTFTKPKPKNAKYNINSIISIDNSKTYFSSIPKTVVKGKVIMFCTDPQDKLAYMVRFKDEDGKENHIVLVYEDEILDKTI